MEEIPHHVWVCLNSLLLVGSTPLDLRSDVLRAGELSYAFLDRRCLQAARAWPWKLCRGDVLEALTRLGEGGTVDEDSTTAKLQRLVRSGYSMEMLSAGIALLAQAPWSTRCVEQAHGSLAQSMRKHPEYSAEAASLRSYLSVARALFERVASERVEAVVQSASTSATRRVPQRSRGVSVYPRRE